MPKRKAPNRRNHGRCTRSNPHPEVVDVSSSEDDNVDAAAMFDMIDVVKLSKKARELKDNGNCHFSEFKKRENLMGHDRKKTLLNWAIQSYETSYALCKRALTGNAGEEPAKVVVLHRREVIDLMKSLSKNAAVMYSYLAGVETVPGTKTHCFYKSAEVSSTCKQLCYIIL